MELPLALAGAGTMLLIVAVVVGFLAFVLLILFFMHVTLWIRCVTTKADIGFFELVGMTLRKVRAETIVQAKIMAVKAGLPVQTGRLEAHYLAGGNVPRVVRALIAAHRAGIELDFDRATGIDLAGRDVLEAVQVSVNPRVIDCPDSTKGRSTIDAVAKDGIQVKAKARVTVRANVEKLVGGAWMETVSYTHLRAHET